MAKVKLVFGVKDITYGWAYGEDTADPNTTTGDVAEKLEQHYKIFKFFYWYYQDEIDKMAKQSISDFLAGILRGTVKVSNKKTIYLDDAVPLFHAMLDTKVMDGERGIPTKRSLQGIIHRRKKRKVFTKGKGKHKTVVARPSFEDSLLYRNSFKCWLEIIL